MVGAQDRMFKDDECKTSERIDPIVFGLKDLDDEDVWD